MKVDVSFHVFVGKKEVQILDVAEQLACNELPCRVGARFRFFIVLPMCLIIACVIVAEIFEIDMKGQEAILVHSSVKWGRSWCLGNIFSPPTLTTQSDNEGSPAVLVAE